MFAAEVAALAINRRLSAEVKADLARHSGRYIALVLPGRRLVFGIDGDGNLRAASPLIQTDAEITPFAESGGGDDGGDTVRIAGDAKLLTALSMAWKECADIEGGLAAITGAPLAADITAAAKTAIGECKTAISGHLITEEELNDFKAKVRAFTTRRGK